MKIMTVSGDQQITALVNRIFAVPPSNAERVARAVQALKDANPHLGDSTTVPAGTPIVIPDLPDLPQRTIEPEPGGPLDDLQAQAKQALADARSAIDDAATEAAQEAKDSLDVLRSREFRALAGPANIGVDALTDRVNQAAKDADARSKAEIANLDALAGALDELMKAIDASTATA